jgi:O-antigen ligase/tetratricopeptide (TPR) repeat protein
MRRYGAWVAILLLSLYLVFVGGGWSGLYESQLRTASVALASVALLTWLVLAWRNPEWRPRSVLLPAIVVALGSLAVSTVFSRHPRQSVEYLGYAILLAALYLLLVRLLREPFFRTRIGALSVMLVVVVGAAYAIANIAHWVAWWQVIGRVAVPPLRPESESLVYGNPSAVLTLVLLLACSAIAVVGLESGRRRLIVGLVLALAAFATLVSGSRSGWLAIGFAVVATTVLLASDGERRRQVRDRLATWASDVRGRVALAIAGIGSLGALVVLAPVIIRRLTDSGADLRLNFVVAAGRMFGEAPLVGTGPGTWVVQRIAYTTAPETDYYIPHAHNIYAQTAAELGIVGLVAGVVLLLSLALLVGDSLRDDDPVRRRWGWAAAFALVYFAAHQALDFYANMTAILFAAALPVAWLDATATGPITALGRELPQRLNRAASLAGVTLLVLAVTGLLMSESAAMTEEAAVAHANVGDWAAADADAELAVAADPAWSPYQLTMGLTAANVGDHERSVEAFSRVAETDDLPEAWLNLAAEEALLGYDDAARDALAGAFRLGLQRPALAMGIGELAERLGDVTLADRAYIAAIATVPSLAGDPWWQSDPARAARFPAIIDAAIEAARPADAWQVALMAGDAQRARELARAAAGGVDPAFENLVVDAWTGNDTAFREILAIGGAEPLNGAALGWAARLHARRGDDATANLYRRWAFTASSVAVPTGAELRVSDGPKIGRTVAGTVAEFWGTYTYRRPTPWNILVPSLIQLELQ